MSDRFIVTGNFTDDPFAIDMAQYIGLREDISDVVSLKTFANSEFCPRYMLDMDDLEHIGKRLEGKIVLICSVSNHERSRNDYAMRNFILARAAKARTTVQNRSSWLNRTSSTAPRIAARTASVNSKRTARTSTSRNSTARHSQASSTPSF